MKQYSYLFRIVSQIALFYLAMTSSNQAQTVEPDTTLTPHNSIVIPQSDRILEITGGVQAGNNLFHSFREFSVPNGSTAYFNNNLEIQNIFSRVTGNLKSEINGIIRANGIANLFLLNPNGIIFGANAHLDLKGSFLATTASSLLFENGYEFSSTDSQAPSLLTIKFPIGLRFRENSGGIIKSAAATLQLQPENTLALVGGDVILDGGVIDTLGGHVALGGLRSAGTIGLEKDGNYVRLNFPDAVILGNVSVIDRARVGVAAGNGGSIAIDSQNLDVKNSTLLAGIKESLGSLSSQAGNITINAAGTLTVIKSQIFNRVEKGATGHAGDITIKAGSIFADDGEIATVSLGMGNTGNILIQANASIDLTGVSGPIRNNIDDAKAQGNGGTIDIRGRSLSLTGGTQIQARTRGRGNTGDVDINIDDRISITGESSNGIPSGIFNLVRENAEGNGGNINIKTATLFLNEGGQVIARTLSKGNAGHITINASYTLALSTDTPTNTSAIASLVSPGSRGNGGNIEIQTRSLSLTSGAQISSGVFRASESLPGGVGNGGNIAIDASESVILSGTGVRGYSSGLFSLTERGATGNAGNINIRTSIFRVTDGAVVNAQTQNSSKGGNIIINSKTFEALGGGQIQSGTTDRGDAGSIFINATEGVTILGSDSTFADRFAKFNTDIVGNDGPASGIFANTTLNSTGKGGNVVIDTSQVTIRDRATITVSSQGEGDAGNINLQAHLLTLDNQASLTAETNRGQGGNITLNVQERLQLRNNSQISTTSDGNGGNITIGTRFLIGAGNSDITANSDNAAGGKVIVNAQGIFRTPDSDITATSALGPQFSGIVELNTPEIDPSQGIVEFPQIVINPTTLVAQNPCRQGRKNELTIAGRGGLPPSVTEDLSSDAVQVGLVEPVPPQNKPIEGKTIAPASTSIEPAQGWIFNEKGEVVLTAYNPNVTEAQRLRETSANCSTP
jgi:filamentous hemagglutinin family protein